MKVFSCLKMCQINSEGRADVDTHSKIFFNRCIFDKHKTLVLQLEKGILMGRQRQRERDTHTEGEREIERHAQTDRERDKRRERHTHTQKERETRRERLV